MLTYPDGRKSWPLFIDSRFRDHAPVNQFRVIQHTVDTLELQVAAERALNAGERNALAKTLQESMEYPFKIEITEHAEIARGAGGKYEDFRSNVE
jgi:phenylacetate-CoA ligase